MKTKIFLILVIAAAFFSVQTIASVFANKVAAAQIPVAGSVPATLQSPCNGGFLFFITGPAPNFVFSTFPILGSNQLGNLPAAPVPCILGIIPQGVGFLAPPPGPLFNFGP